MKIVVTGAAGFIATNLLPLIGSFFEGTEPGFVNGALDAVARDVRAQS